MKTTKKTATTRATQPTNSAPMKTTKKAPTSTALLHPLATAGHTWPTIRGVIESILITPAADQTHVLYA